MEETLQDNVEHLTIAEDSDAMVGHKIADRSFFGYKAHIGMTEERIITAATITTGEKSDGKELEMLYRKSKDAGMKIDTIIGDIAYSEKGNIELAKKESVQLVSRLNPVITKVTDRMKLLSYLIEMQGCMSGRAYGSTKT